MSRFTPTQPHTPASLITQAKRLFAWLLSDERGGVAPSPGEQFGSGIDPTGQAKEGGGGTTAPSSGTGAGAPGTSTASAAVSGRQSGASQDVVGSIPGLNVPQGNAVLVREGEAQFRWILDRFEGLDTKRSAQEIGELQAVTLKNALTDEQTLRKRQASDNVNSSTTEATVGLHEVSGLRELTLEACDDQSVWTESDGANFAATDETTIKVEGTGSIQIDATGAAANGDTLLRDLGAGATKDLSSFDYVEVMVRGVKTAGNSIAIGVSEDNATYTSGTFAGTTTETWEVLRIDISGLAAADRNAIRYIRVTATNGATAQIWYMDIIRAVRRVQHRLRMVRTAGTSTGGVRDNPATVTLILSSDESGSWATEGTVETALGNTKMRAVDWFGDTYMMLGSAGAMKFSNGVFSVWEEAPPSHFLALHYDKFWALSQIFEPHGLRHSTVNTVGTWPLDTDAVGGDGGLMYIGRRHGFLPTGLTSAFGQLFIYTEGDLWILFGSSNATFSLQRAHPGAGTLSFESVVAFDDGLIWHDGMGDRVLMWRGGNVFDIGEPIQSVIRDIPSGRKPWTAAVTDGRYYYLSLTRSGQTVNDTVYAFDTRLLRWHGPWQGNWCGFTDAYLGVDGSMYLGTEANGVRKLNDNVAGAEGSREFIVKSGASNFRLPRWSKRVRRMGFKGENLTVGQEFTLKFYLDQSASAIQTYTLTAVGGVSEVLSTGVHDNVVGDNISWELTESSANAVTISQVAIEGYYVRALRP